MRRIVAVSVVALLAWACQDQMSNLTDPPPPNFAVSDGAHGGNGHFYFLTPLVPTPSFSGVFNAGLSPTVVVSQLPFKVMGNNTVPDDGSTDCVVTAVSPTPVRTFGPSEVSVGGETYSVNWQTGQDNLTSGTGYRICVRVFGRDLGYRDVQPDDSGANQPRNPEQRPIFQFNNGSNLPIKFRIEQQALCSTGALDCVETVLGAGGGTGVCVDGTCSLEVTEGALDEDVLFIVERVSCTMVGGRVRHVNVDLPQFPGCMEVTALTEEPFAGFSGDGAIAGACIDAPNLGHDQFDLLQLHHEKANGTVEALASAFAPIDCSDFTQNALEARMNPIQRLAHRGWRRFQQVLSPVWAPEPVHAVDRGFGGGAMVEGSPLVWALPSQMEQLNWTNPEVGTLTTPKMPEVLVTDSDGEPVAGATVRFAVKPDSGDGPPVSPVAVLTGADGIASAEWMLGPAGILNVLEARGLGIGLAAGAEGYYDPPALTPIGGIGPFEDHEGVALDLGTGVLRFTAIVCESGSAPVLNGVVGGSEYVESENFSANVSGGSTPATVYWTNDCDNLYIAVAVQSDAGLNNNLRLIFDNDGDGAAAAGDDILSLEKNKQGNWIFRDSYVTANCLNSKQSSCGSNDPGAAHGHGVFGFDPASGRSIYEIRHPLASGQTNNDFQLGFGDQVGFFLVLQLGGGAQGNTEYPGFRSYQTITIEIP